MRDVHIAGIGMTQFGPLPAMSLDDLGRLAIWDAIDDCGIDPRRIGVAYVGNSYAGLLQGQESGRAATIVREERLNAESALLTWIVAHRPKDQTVKSDDAPRVDPSYLTSSIAILLPGACCMTAIVFGRAAGRAS